MLKETSKKISALIYNAFEDKIAHYNFRGNDLEEEAVHDMIEDCADEIDDILWTVDGKIDNILEELEREYLPSKDDEIAFFQRERERDFFRFNRD